MISQLIIGNDCVQSKRTTDNGKILPDANRIDFLGSVHGLAEKRVLVSQSARLINASLLEHRKYSVPTFIEIIQVFQELVPSSV